jgi:hypothetical protein
MGPLAHEAQALGGRVVPARAWVHGVSHLWCSASALAACRGVGKASPSPQSYAKGDGRDPNNVCGAYSTCPGAAL